MKGPVYVKCSLVAFGYSGHKIYLQFRVKYIKYVLLDGHYLKVRSRIIIYTKGEGNTIPTDKRLIVRGTTGS